MLTYSLDEIIEDIFAFEGVKMAFGKGNEDIRFIQLYSNWADKPLDGDKCVDDLKQVVHKFIEKCSIPPTTTPIPVAGKFVLCAGSKDQPMEIIMATDNNDDFKDAARKVLSSESQYTAVCGLIIDEVFHMERKTNG